MNLIRIWYKIRPDFNEIGSNIEKSRLIKMWDEIIMQLGMNLKWEADRRDKTIKGLVSILNNAILKLRVNKKVF